MTSFEPDTSLDYPVFLEQCISFKEQQESQVWVLFFWAGWNNRSLMEAKKLISVYEAYKHKPVRFVSISVDKSRRVWEEGLHLTQMPWEHLWIPQQKNVDFLADRAFPGAGRVLPTLFVINTKGKIRRMQNSDKLHTELNKLTLSLADVPYEKPPAPTITDEFDSMEQEDSTYAELPENPPTTIPPVEESTGKPPVIQTSMEENPEKESDPIAEEEQPIEPEVTTPEVESPKSEAEEEVLPEQKEEELEPIPTTPEAQEEQPPTQAEESTPTNIQKPAPGPKPNSEPAWIYHDVKRGDTLYSLSRRYGVNIVVIKTLNGMKDNNIQIGQRLRIKRE